MINSRIAAESRQCSCPECGGTCIDGLDCQEMFEMLLAWEWQDPELLARHFLTVSSYLLQHPATLTDDAASGLRTAFTQALSGEVTVAQVRARITRVYDGAARVRRPAREIQPRLRPWSMTVADVYAGGQVGAADRVNTWARTIGADIGEGPGSECCDQG